MKIWESHLRSFGYIQRKEIDAPMKKKKVESK